MEGKVVLSENRLLIPSVLWAGQSCIYGFCLNKNIELSSDLPPLFFIAYLVPEVPSFSRLFQM